MNNIPTAKAFITSLFSSNYDLLLMDDSTFMTLLRKTIEDFSLDQVIRDELKQYFQDLFVEVWLKFSEEEPDDPEQEPIDIKEEKSNAIEEFEDFYEKAEITASNRLNR